ncbi:MAG: response regulator [Burkholderiales bacterium]|nr:response regulator [Burkholderiales bacterium]MDP2398497.1 response regulator [Burkholderiales bacterium]
MPNSTLSPGKRVLLVDDDRLIVTTLARGLRNHGYAVKEATSGGDAIALAQQDAPEIALLDVRMAGLSGLDVARVFRDQLNIPFLFLSAYGDADIVRQAAECGALGYLVKPLDVAQIIPALESALARGRDIRALRETESQLNAALATSRETSTAVGILMARDHIDRESAFNQLRSHARAQRRKIHELSAEMIAALETMNAISGEEKKGRSGSC